MKILITIFFFVLLIPSIQAVAQSVSNKKGIGDQDNGKFTDNTKYAFSNTHVFIENVGQYQNKLEGKNGMGVIKYGYEGFDMPVFFTSNGVIHLQRNRKTISRNNKDQVDDDVITMKWLDANPKVDVVAEVMQHAYYTYGFCNARQKVSNA